MCGICGQPLQDGRAGKHVVDMYGHSKAGGRGSVWYMWTGTARQEGEEVCGICGRAQQNWRTKKCVVYLDSHSRTGGRGSVWYMWTATARREGEEVCDIYVWAQRDGGRAGNCVVYESTTTKRQEAGEVYGICVDS